MLLTYTTAREPEGVKYFSQYKDGANMSYMWKIVGSVKFDLEPETKKILAIDFRVLDFTTIADFNTVLMMTPRYFPNFTCEYIKGHKNKKGEIIPCIPTIKITPKEETLFIDIPEGLKDKITTKLVTDEQMAKLRDSVGFVN